MVRYSVKNEVYNKHPEELHNRGYLKQALIYLLTTVVKLPRVLIKHLIFNSV